MMARVVFVVQGESYNACLEQARLYLQGTGITDYACLPTTPRPEPQRSIAESQLQCVADRAGELQEEVAALEQRLADMSALLTAGC